MCARGIKGSSGQYAEPQPCANISCLFSTIPGVSPTIVCYTRVDISMSESAAIRCVTCIQQAETQCRALARGDSLQTRGHNQTSTTSAAVAIQSCRASSLHASERNVARCDLVILQISPRGQAASWGRRRRRQSRRESEVH